MKRLTLAAFVLTAVVILVSCNDAGKESSKSDSATTSESTGQEVHGNEVKPGEVTLSTPLNAEWVANGKNIYDVKCQGCHKLDSTRLVGPGWKDVTKRRKPEWIMNMITNVDMMLETDPEAQKLLEQCLVRMPNQNISNPEAREILEFMRSNDGEK